MKGRLITAFVFILSQVQLLAWTNGELTIWMDADRVSAVRQIAKKFEDHFGIKVVLETPEKITNNFPMSAQVGKGPDIVIWAHDKIGEWADSGLIAPLNLTAEYEQKFFPKAWEAVTHAKQIWGYPLSFEVIGLIYNKKLVNGKPPGQLEELIALNQRIKAENPRLLSILWDYTSPYYTWGILASGGAYIYGRDAEGYDLKNIGVDCPAAVKALNQIIELIKCGVLPKSASSTNMPKELMARNDLAMTISGPWDWPDLTKSGIDFGVAPMPGIDGHPGKAFIGVSAAYINRTSPNRDLAIEFLENFAITDEGLRLADQAKPIGMPALISAYNQMAEHNDLLRQLKVCFDDGEVMPNVPQMGRFWSAVGSALQLATNGQQSAEAALANAKQEMILPEVSGRPH
jgi:maltose/maltodextrin transport system substrate-binding protein